MQISDQLPLSAVPEIDKFNEDDEHDHQDNDSSTESESEVEGGKKHAPTSKLDSMDMKKLITCYRQIYPDYDKLFSTYKMGSVEFMNKPQLAIYLGGLQHLAPQ